MIDLGVIRNICLAAAVGFGAKLLVVSAGQLWMLWQSPPL